MQCVEVRIVETARDCLKCKPGTFNDFRQRFADLEGVKEFLTERYGKLPNRKNKVYVDKKDGSAEEIGFTHSFWNRDVSHSSKCWFQTDWVEIVDVKETPRLL